MKDPWELLQKALPGSDTSVFRFSMPVSLFEKSKKNDGEQKRYLEGVASTPMKDLQMETVIQKGIDFEYFLKHGYFNDDHKPGAENKVGQPTDAEIRNVTDKFGNKSLGFWTAGFLWPEGQHKGADALWTLGKALKESNADRKLGMSVQGKVLQRDGTRIVKSWIQDVAITPSPMNTATWMDFVENLGKNLVSAKESKEIAKSLAAFHLTAEGRELGQSLEERLFQKSLFSDSSEKLQQQATGEDLLDIEAAWLEAFTKFRPYLSQKEACLKAIEVVAKAAL